METPDKYMGWTEDPISVAWENFELCDECNGNKICPVCGGSGCGYNSSANGYKCAGRGWCILCGGAGQWPVDPKIKYFCPDVCLINLHVVAENLKWRLFKSGISETDFMLKLKIEPEENEIYRMSDEKGRIIYCIGYKNQMRFDSPEKCWETFRQKPIYKQLFIPISIQEPFKSWLAVEQEQMLLQLKSTKGMITGRFTSADGLALKEAMIELENSSHYNCEYADDDGNFEIEHVPPGIYRVLFLAQGYFPVIVNNVEISAGKTIRLDAVFSADPDAKPDDEDWDDTDKFELEEEE
jgi:hypothetical protein